MYDKRGQLKKQGILLRNREGESWKGEEKQNNTAKRKITYGRAS